MAVNQQTPHVFDKFYNSIFLLIPKIFTKLHLKNIIRVLVGG
jgi:hypothetical protein